MCHTFRYGCEPGRDGRDFPYATADHRYLLDEHDQQLGPGRWSRFTNRACYTSRYVWNAGNISSVRYRWSRPEWSVAPDRLLTDSPEHCCSDAGSQWLSSSLSCEFQCAYHRYRR